MFWEKLAGGKAEAQFGVRLRAWVGWRELSGALQSLRNVGVDDDDAGDGGVCEAAGPSFCDLLID